MGKNGKFTKRHGFACSEQQKVEMAKKGMKPEHFRNFIESYGDNGEHAKIKSSEWKRLKEILIKVPSLQLIGDVGAGKTHLTRELVRNDRDHIYIVLDSHGGFDFLPQIHQISPKLTESSLLVMNKMDDAAGLNFKMYKSLIQYDTYPKHFILVVEESLRYKKHGIINMLAESRKFLKVLCITQEKIVDFVPDINVENYNKVAI
jgi:hypothetical protein